MALMIPDAANMRVRNTVALCNIHQRLTGLRLSLNAQDDFRLQFCCYRSLSAPQKSGRSVLHAVRSVLLWRSPIEVCFAVVQRVAIQMAGDVGVRWLWPGEGKQHKLVYWLLHFRIIACSGIYIHVPITVM